MDHTPGQRQFRDVEKLKAYVMGKQGLSEQEFEEHVDRLAGLQARHGAAHEAVAVAEARRYGAVLASHDDTTEAHVAVSARHGARLAEFPTTQEAAAACRAHGIAVMMGAPNLIRGGSHSGNVAARALAEAELLDILSSDYVPAALLLAAVRLGTLWDDMARGIATVTAAPARAVGLEDRGMLQPGRRADVIRFALEGDTPRLRGVWARGARVA
jgi:alpha-D-ribose 1-methylphosphonate 5-triphosphate diphosphatase